MLAHVRGNLLEIQQQSALTQGTVGQKLSISFSDDWAPLSVTAIFSAGALTRDVVVSGGEITVPWELFTEAEHKLFVNFHGALPDGSIVMRTNIACLGTVLPSRSPSGSTPESPSPARADQIQALAEAAMAVAQSVRRDADAGLFDGAALPVSIDSVLSGTSENPVQNRVVKAALDEKGTYSKPSGGIPKTDLASAVKTSLDKADSAIAAPASPISGQFLTWSGSAWVASDLPVYSGGVL